jgi:hypothetical protein
MMRRIPNVMTKILSLLFLLFFFGFTDSFSVSTDILYLFIVFFSLWPGKCIIGQNIMPNETGGIVFAAG